MGIAIFLSLHLRPKTFHLLILVTMFDIWSAYLARTIANDLAQRHIAKSLLFIDLRVLSSVPTRNTR